MRVGDVIELTDPAPTRLGIVRRIENRMRMAVVQFGPDPVFEEISDDFDATDEAKCRVLSNPLDDWPFVKAPDRPRLGRFLYPALPVRGDLRELVLFQEYVPTGTGNMVSLFLSPSLRLIPGHMLVAVHEKGTGRIDIVSGFGTVAQRMAKAAPPPVDVQPLSAAHRLMRDD